MVFDGFFFCLSVYVWVELLYQIDERSFSCFPVGSTESEGFLFSSLALLWHLRSLQCGRKWPVFLGKVDTSPVKRSSGPRGPTLQGNVVGDRLQIRDIPVLSPVAICCQQCSFDVWWQGELGEPGCLLCCFVLPARTTSDLYGTPQRLH